MAGFNVLVPFIDRVRYKHNLKEQAIDVASQICITRDNISVEVDGILYLQVIDAMKASEIEQVATANGIRAIALAINEEGGKDAVILRIAEQYLMEL